MTNPVNPNAPQASSMFGTLGVATRGLSAHRLRMETVAMNIANAETTRTAEGGPYRRRLVTFEGVGSEFAGALGAATSDADAQDSLVPTVIEDTTPGPRVYEPGHPDADADGYVTYPNVNVTDEMVELMDARRMFEANATVFQAAKAMLHRSLEI